MAFSNTKQNSQKPFKRQGGFSCEFFSAKKISQKGIFVVVSKKIDKKAVNRNLIKRRTREAFRLVLKDENQTVAFGIKIFPTKELMTADFSKLKLSVKIFLKHYKTTAD